MYVSLLCDRAAHCCCCLRQFHVRLYPSGKPKCEWKGKCPLLVSDIVPELPYKAKTEGMWQCLLHFCGVMGTFGLRHLRLALVRRGGEVESRLETKSTAWQCNYSLWHWLIGKWEIRLKGWSVWTRSCCLTNYHWERWTWSMAVEHTRCGWRTCAHTHIGSWN